MTFTYTDPSASTLEAVRFLVNDTVEADAWLSDEEIEYTLALWADRTENVYMLAAAVAEQIAAMCAKKVDISADGVTVRYGDMADKFNKLATSLRQSGRDLAPGGPLLSGALFDDGYDPTIRPTVFGIGVMDNVEAGRQDFGGQAVRNESGWPV